MEDKLEAGTERATVRQQCVNAGFLVHNSLRKVPVKNLALPFRPLRDLQTDTVVVLDVPVCELRDVVGDLLMKIYSGNRKLVEPILGEVFLDGGDDELTERLMAARIRREHEVFFDNTFLCIPATSASIRTRAAGICRLASPVNFGPHAEQVRFVIVVVTPINEKATKTSLEVLRTFATLFSDPRVRHELCKASVDEQHFPQRLIEFMTELSDAKIRQQKAAESSSVHSGKDPFSLIPFKGIVGDLRRRLPHYCSDYVDGVRDLRSVSKTASTSLFLFFGILLPLIAFGTLNNTNTEGWITVRKTLISQTIGGVAFALLSGQPLVILMTTAPLSLYIKVIYTLSVEWNTEFNVMYAWVGIFNTAFLIIYSVFNASYIMRWCSRSTEEIFSIFITVAFFIDSIKDVVKSFHEHYSPCRNSTSTTTSGPDGLISYQTAIEENCRRDVCLLFLLLMLGTLWLGLTLFNATKTPFLGRRIRELLADYALPLAVVTMSLIGVYAFADIPSNNFEDSSDRPIFEVAKLANISTDALLICLVLGFPLSLLFLMDQNISAAMVDAPAHKLVKGPAYDWDIAVVAILNGALSIFGFPWMHGVLPHSPLHAILMADCEEQVTEGYVQRVVVKSRETRLTALFCHVLMGLSILLVPQPLGSIPTAVLDGLFLYIAVSSLAGNQFFERVLLLFTEQSAYPPSHYVRRCPQASIHRFTLLQLVQLGIFIFFGFSPWPYVTMVFPVVIMALMAVRQLLVPFIVDRKFLAVLDGKEH